MSYHISFVNNCKKLYNREQIDSGISGITELFKLADESLFSSV